MGKILQAGENGFTYIYTLTDPITNEIRYVGKSNNPTVRLNEHVRKSKYTHTHKNNWITSLLKLGQKPIIDVVDIVSINECGFWENYWINTFKAWGFKLTNIAIGGVGGDLGIVVRNKISAKLKNRKFNNETIQKMKFAAKHRKLSDAGRESLRNHRKGKNNSMFGKHQPESSKQYRSIIQLDLNSNHIKIWKGIIVASKELNINRCTISDVCNNRKKTAGGFKWEYVK